MLLTIVLATVIVSAVSLVGILVFFKKKLVSTYLKPLVSLAAGTLLGLAFLDILPEAIEEAEGVFEPHFIAGVVLVSILVFFLFERLWHWHHCSDELRPELHNHKEKSVAYLNLAGDAVHNLIDGFLIAGAFLLDFQVGVATTLAVILHEIPQEIADFSVLMHSGLTRAQAIWANLGVSVVAVLGAVVFYFFGSQVTNAIPVMAAIAAGNFIYLSMADLIPALHHETDRKTIVASTLWLLVGVGLIYLIIQVVPHSH